MTLSRRTVLGWPLGAAASVALGGCGLGGGSGGGRGSGGGGGGNGRSGATRVHVMGAIHGRHRTSPAYSLARLEQALRRAAPDLVLVELPPQNLAAALASFRATGAVDEPRARVFPELTDVAIPLAEELGWMMRGVAAWSPTIATEREAALAAIQRDPARAAQWAEHEAATRHFARAVAGRSDDPRFIHTATFDARVAASFEPFARHFDADLGAGSWTRINAAHIALINAALDAVSGAGLTALILFGTAHKYKFRQSLGARADVQLEDTRALFA